MKKGFTLVELLGVIIVLGVIALITFPIIDKSIKSSKEKALNQIINNIENAAYEYSISNDIGYQTYYKSLALDTLISAGILKDNIINPVTNSNMNGCVLYRWNEEYKQYEFTYDEECNVPIITIYDIVIDQIPYLATNGNGCITSTDNNYSYIGGCYIKGNPNNNYIWYSGFLWRIMGINADGTIRLITDENVTGIPYHESSFSWDGSYARDWLNDYFYSRLKGNDIIVEQTWCSETTTDSSSARTTCTNNLSKESAYVGLMTLDEYNLAGGSSSYLNIRQYQWTMTGNNSRAFYIDSYGYINGYSYFDVSNTHGLRAVINVNSDITITGGNGTQGATWSSEAGPYILNEDKSVEVTGKLNEKATSGEYVLFAGKKYRVVDKDSNGNTKLILDGYYEENESVFEMEYGDNNTFSTETGIGQKLNGDVLNWLTNNDESEKGKLVSDYTWYQNIFDLGYDYKISLNETEPTRSIQATVGLIRVGEMLSGQSSSILTKGYTTTSSDNNANYYWIMTPHTSNSKAWFVSSSGRAIIPSVSGSGGLRAVIVVNSDVTITGGNGTWSNPYVI